MARPELERWLASVEAQLDAVRRVDSQAVADTTECRRAMQSMIDARLVARWSPAERAEARTIALRVQRLDQRIRACGTAVLAALQTVLPAQGVTTYGRRGNLTGGY